MIEKQKMKIKERQAILRRMEEEIARQRAEEIARYTYDSYIQQINWDNEPLMRLSDILRKPQKEVTVFDSEHEYIQPIKTKNTLKDIMSAVQEFYNHVIPMSERGCFYIENFVCTEYSDHLELDFGYGT